MFEYHWFADTGTLVKNNRDYILTFDNWAKSFYTDNSNAYAHSVLGLEINPKCKKITEEEAEAFIRANQF